MATQPLQAVFVALADPTRRQMLTRLSEQGPGTATQLAAGLPITRQAVTKHLLALSEAGLVTAQRQGREKRYVLAPEALDDAMAWMAEVGAAWDERLEALRHHLVTKPGREGSAKDDC